MNSSVKDNLENPFKGYLKNLKKHKSAVNPVHEIVNCYYKINGWEKMPKEFYIGRYAYNKLAKEAKLLAEEAKSQGWIDYIDETLEEGNK